MSNKWNLTKDRQKELIKLLKAQYTVPAAAEAMGVCRDTLVKRMNEEGIDRKQIADMGKSSMRTMLFMTTLNIKDDAKRAAAALAYLTKYPMLDEVEIENTLDDKPTDSEILSKIRKELDGVK